MTVTQTRLARWAVFASAAGCACPVAAHGIDDALLRDLGPFGAGLGHPVLGPDHFLAMFAVGLLSAALGGRHLWRVPLCFVATMPLGWLLGRVAGPFAPVEIGIALSVMLLGAATFWSHRLPLAGIYAAVAVFALLHGYAHGVEMPAGGPMATYAAGFMVGTAVIHVLGLFIGDLLVGQRARGAGLSALSLVIAAAGAGFTAQVLSQTLHSA